MKKTELTQILAQIKLGYPNFLLNEEVISFWYRHLADVPFEKAQRNLDLHVRSISYEPKIADIIKYDPEQYVNYDTLRIETQQRLAALDKPKPNISEEKLAEIKRRVDSGELDDKYKDDPYLGGDSE